MVGVLVEAALRRRESRQDHQPVCGEVNSPLLLFGRAAAFGVRRLAAAFLVGQNSKAGASSRTPKRAVRTPSNSYHLRTPT